MNRLSSFVFLLLALVSGYASAQVLPPPRSQAILITIGPGDEVWEKFGHNMLWLRSPERGIDLCYNWGLFDFDQPGFITNFIQGRMTYWMDGFRPNFILAEYFDHKRHTTMQRLNLTPQQVDRLIDLCEENRLPVNKYYKYDYFKDNCSTRVRDMIDRVTEGSLQRLQTIYAPNAKSYRWQSTRLTQSDLLVTVGMDFAMGPAGDRPLTKWEECFLPEKLSEYVGPLVETTREPWPSDRPATPDKPPIYWPWLMAIGLACFGVIVFVARWKRRAASLLIGLWWFISGFGGVFMAYFWCFTDHTATYANENLWHFSPLAWSGLTMLILRSPRAVRRIAMTIAVISVAGLMLRAATLLTQQNWDFIALAVPLNLATAWAYAKRPLDQYPLTPEPVPSEVVGSS